MDINCQLVEWMKFGVSLEDVGGGEGADPSLNHATLIWPINQANSS